MINCEKCQKEFINMSSLKKHQTRKTPCDIDIKKEAKQKEVIQKEVTQKEDTQKEDDNINVEIDVKNEEGLKYLASIDDNSIDLILTDPPYIISKDTGMDKHYNKVKENEKNNIEFMKTEEEWDEYKKTLDKPQSELDNNKGPGWSKENYLKYGTILGKKYCSKTQYGEWDNNFTIDDLEKFIEEYYKKLRRGGTLIIWFDLWKITTLKEILEKYKFKQIRFIEWIKTNPLPINSKINYLTNSREIALLAIKDSNPTFNSSYDNGIYQFPMASGKNKFHPTQKNLELFEKLIEKHSNENDTVLDTFLGGGTTAIACKNKKRNFKGCEINKEYVDKINQICF
jgi:DNA modification methylase